MFQSRLLALAISAATLTIAGCNSNSNEQNTSSSAQSGLSTATTTTISVTPSLGKIRNARVILRNARTGEDIAPAKPLNDAGSAVFHVSLAKLTEPVMAAVVPNASGDVQYFDEALNRLVTLTITDANRNTPFLRAAATVKTNAAIGVSALTEAAVQTAEAKAGGLAANIDTVNTLIQSQLKLPFSIVQTPAVIGAVEGYSRLADPELEQSQRLYAAYLALLARQAVAINPDSARPALDMVNTLAADFKDDATLNASFDEQHSAIDYTPDFATAWADVVESLKIELEKLPATLASPDEFFAAAGHRLPVARPVRVASGIAEYACADASKVHVGVKSSQSMIFNILPSPDRSLQVFELDRAGQKHLLTPIETIRSSESFNGHVKSYQTAANRPLLISTPEGECKGIFRSMTPGDKGVNVEANGAALLSLTPHPLLNPLQSLGASFYSACESEGGDDRLGFKVLEYTGPVSQKLCGFSRVSSSVAPETGTYTFVNDNAQVTIVVKNDRVSNVSIDDGFAGYSCGDRPGMPTPPACSGVSVVSGAGHTKFVFNNTRLISFEGGLTIKNGTLTHLSPE